MTNYDNFFHYIDSYITDALTLWGFSKIHIPYLFLEATYYYIKDGGNPP